MSYFITEQKLELNTPAILSDPDVAHILFSRRAKIGDLIPIQDTSHTRFECEITSATKHSLTVIPHRILAVIKEPEFKIHVFQALISESALDIVLQKSTELGAASITIFNAHRSPLRLDETGFTKKQGRWQKIALEAAKQSDRLLAPEVHFALDLPSSLRKIHCPLFILDPQTTNNLHDQALSGSEAAFLVGPEGGFDDRELKLLSEQADILPIRLGPRILRAETASIASLAILQAKFGDMQ